MCALEGALVRTAPVAVAPPTKSELGNRESVLLPCRMLSLSHSVSKKLHMCVCVCVCVHVYIAS